MDVKTHEPQVACLPGGNPTIASYNASVVKIYSAVNSMARFYIKNIFFSI
jgi:hypothetical protein